MPTLFRLSDRYSIEQYHKITAVLRKYDGVTAIAYQSNWYITIACHDFFTASEIRFKLLGKEKDWEIQIRPGRKNRIRHYLQVKLLRK